MEWAILFLAFDLIALALLLGHSDRVPTKIAAGHMKAGALLVDVRRPSEYAFSHLRDAVNIPVTGIRELVPLRIQDKERAILLYGQVGVRSSLARQKLKAMGYSNAFNLGSYERAVKIANENRPTVVWSDAHRAKAIEEALRQKESGRRQSFGTTVRVSG